MNVYAVLGSILGGVLINIILAFLFRLILAKVFKNEKILISRKIFFVTAIICCILYTIINQNDVYEYVQMYLVYILSAIICSVAEYISELKNTLAYYKGESK